MLWREAYVFKTLPYSFTLYLRVFDHYLCIYLTLFVAGFLCAFRDPISSQI